MMHELKTWPEYFVSVFNREKTFEVRRNDRDFKVGDVLKLMEYDISRKRYSGRYIITQVSYILEGEGFGIREGYVVMGLHKEMIVNHKMEPQP